MKIIDITQGHGKPRLYARTRKATGITGIVVHQTDCYFSPKSWVRLNAHYGITRAGEVNYVNPVTDFIWHAQGLSGPNVGIEVEGKFPGQDSKPTPERPDGLTDGQKEGIRDCLEHIASVCPHRPLAIYAHRQSTAARRIDPGEAIWRFIVEAVELDDRFVLKPLVALGSGRPIPACWGGVKGETL